MEFVQIILDFVTLGAFGLFSTITLMIWFSFCEVFIFEEGYLQWLKKRPALRIAVVLISGALIWGTLLVQTHKFLWGEQSVIDAQETDN